MKHMSYGFCFCGADTQEYQQVLYGTRQFRKNILEKIKTMVHDHRRFWPFMIAKYWCKFEEVLH
jgi:hypothetical protein